METAWLAVADLRRCENEAVKYLETEQQQQPLPQSHDQVVWPFVETAASARQEPLLSVDSFRLLGFPVRYQLWKTVVMVT